MPNRESPWKALSLVTVIGMDIVVCTLIGVWLGRHADRHYGIAPWGLVSGVMVGLAVGILIIVPFIRKLLREQSNDR